MNRVYWQIWKKAQVFYLKGRPSDIAHIIWMMKKALSICQKEKLDDTLLIPLVILHDVGYSVIENIRDANYYKENIRKEHMKAGAKIAQRILKELNYPENKIKKISHYISVHDNWSFGEVDIYCKDKILGNFKDLDYIWSYTPEGCAITQKTLKKTNKEMLEYLINELSPIGGKKPFSSLSTKILHKYYLDKIKTILT